MLGKGSLKNRAKKGRMAGKIQDLPSKAKRPEAVRGGIVTSAGPGGAPLVKVFDRKTGG